MIPSAHQPCGCWWEVRQGVMVFRSRCVEHEPMHRDLEPWEINLIAFAELDYSEMNWCGFCLIPVPSGVEPLHNVDCPTL